MDIEIGGELSKLNGNAYMNTFKILGDVFIFLFFGNKADFFAALKIGNWYR